MSSKLSARSERIINLLYKYHIPDHCQCKCLRQIVLELCVPVAECSSMRKCIHQYPYAIVVVVVVYVLAMQMFAFRDITGSPGGIRTKLHAALSY